MSTTNPGFQSSLYQKVVLRPLGLNADNGLVLWLLVISALILTSSLIYFEGDVAMMVAVLYVVSIFVISFLKPDLSLMILIALTLIFDQFGIPEFDPITYQIDFFRNLKEVSYIPQNESGVFNIIELHLLLIMMSLVLVTGVKKDFSFRSVPVWGACAFFFMLYAFGFFYGLQQGGDFMIAMWEVRALFYFFAVFLITPQLIRSRKQLHAIMWIFMVTITIKAFQAIYRFIDMGFTTGGLATLSNHEDPIFLNTLFILFAAFVIFKVRNKQFIYLLVLILPLLLGFYFGMRRAAYAAGMVSAAVFFLLLPPDSRRTFIKIAIPAVIFLAIYSAAFWDNQGRLGRPIQMVKSGFERPTMEENYADYYSNLYREFENYNLAYTVTNHPVVGTGFGVAYDQPISLFAIRFPLQDYIPHNEIIWIMVKMGALGFFAFWLFFNSFVAKGVRVLSRLDDPYLKAITVFIVVAVINQMVVSFFDLQLTYYRNMIYLGCVMGLLTTVEILHKEDKEEEKKELISQENRNY